MNTESLEELEEAKNLLIKQKPIVLAYQADEGRDTIISEDADIGFMYSGDALLMISENSDLKYILPKEGANLWYDAMVIPKTAQNIEGAYKFINFMCDPENAAINAKYSYGYSSPIEKAVELLPNEIKNSAIAYPKAVDLKNAEIYKNKRELIFVYDRIWTEVTTSR